MNTVDGIMRYEGGEMDAEETTAFFQHLLDTGVVWNLQGHYGRTAVALIDAGLIADKRAALGLAVTTFRRNGKAAHPPGFRPLGGRQ